MMKINYLILMSLLAQQACADIYINPDAAQTISQAYSPTADHLRQQTDQQRAAQAAATGQGFIGNGPNPNDPKAWQAKVTATPEVALPVDHTAEIAGLKNILNGWQAKPAAFKSVEFASPVMTQSNTGATTVPLTPLAVAGTRWYATFAGGADSYVPGVVRVELEEGPFAGGYALGKFDLAPDGEHLLLKFTTLTYQQQSYAIDAVGVDPTSQLSGVTGDIDHHAMTRFVVPAAVGFIEGAINLLNTGQSVVATSNGTVVTTPPLNDGRLGLLMASNAAKALKTATTPEGVLRLPEVKIAPGSSLGFLLLQPIFGGKV